jgi:uncharacterized membrane protein
MAKTPKPVADPVPHTPPTGLINVDRLTFLIDGVFAIALTLLVLDLRPPEVANLALASGLINMLPRLAIYLLAFYTIANQWTVHFQSFRHVRYVDLTLVWLSLANLLFMTLLPASTALVGRYPFEPMAAACFSVNSLLMSLGVVGIWSYVYRQRARFAPEADPKILRGIAFVWLFVSIGLAVALLVSFFNTVVTYGIIVLWPLLVSSIWAVRRRRFQKIRSKRDERA